MNANGNPARQPLPMPPSAAFSKARKWLLAVSILTLISGLIIFAIGRSDVEQEIQQARAAIVGLDPAMVDAEMKAKTGMTFDEAIAHDRGQVTLLLAINIALAVIYFGLFLWAKSNPYLAALIALLLFITVIVISAVYDPKTIASGVLVKIFFISALIKAVQEGQQERRFQAAL